MGIRPVDARHPYSQFFGANPASHQPAGHTGEDIAAPIGTPVLAIADGKVMWADWGTKLPGDNSHAGWVSRFYLDKDFCGIPVILEHDDCYSIYSHLNETDLNNFEMVKQGQIIGRVGNTGYSTGPHLHWEIIPKNPNWNNGFYGRVNPAPYRQETLSKKSPIVVKPASTVTSVAVPEKKTPKELNPTGWSVWSYTNPRVTDKDAYAVLNGIDKKLDELLKRLDEK